MEVSESVPSVVLVVDDEALIRMFACDWLTDHGFQTMEAEDGREALTLLERCPEINVLLTDVNMPGRPDGIGLAHDARRRRPELRIIVTSGRVMPQSGDLPADSCFVAKPYTGAQLLAAIGADR